MTRLQGAHQPPNGRAFSGEPSERSERPERRRGRRVRCNAMLGGRRHAERATHREHRVALLIVTIRTSYRDELIRQGRPPEVRNGTVSGARQGRSRSTAELPRRPNSKGALPACQAQTFRE